MKDPKRLSLKEIKEKDGFFYVYYDEETELYSIFDSEEGFAFCSFYGEKEANKKCAEYNEILRRLAI